MRRRDRTAARRLERSGPLLLLAGLAVGVPARADLEVAIPPGSPLDWTLSIPVLPSRTGTTFPVPPPPLETGERPESDADRRPGSSTGRRTTNGLGVLRITTWDLLSEVPWVRRAVREIGARRQQGPVAGDGLYWVALAPLLRLMLHRALVSEPEALAHLLEIGDPIRSVLAVASTENCLRRPAADLLDRLGKAREPLEPPTEPAETREEMLTRFVREELLRYHPFDPEGAFGARLMLFGDELEPYLRRLALSGEPLVARNATAELGRRRTASAGRALVRLANTTYDDVIFVRALAALPEIAAGLEEDEALDWTPLVRKLEKERDDVRTVALVHALSRAGVKAIVPRLLQLGRRALDDPDLLDAVLAALARYPHKEHHAAVTELAQDVEKRVRRNPRGFRVQRPEPSQLPDFVDQPETRGRVLLHRVLVLRARLDTLDEELAREVIELGNAPGGSDYVWIQRDAHQNGAVRGVVPPVRFQYLGTLARLGEPGHAVLRGTAGSPDADPMLRAAAIGELSYRDRSTVCVAVVRSDAESPGLRAFALERLLLDRNPAGAELARELLRDLAPRIAGDLSSGDRELYRMALRLLSERDLADADLLLPLLRQVEAGARPGTVADRLRAAAVELVREIAGSAKGKTVEKRLANLLDLALEHRVNPRLTPDTREEYAKEVEGRVAGVRHDSGAEYLALVTRSVLEAVSGHPVEEVQEDHVDGTAGELPEALAGTVPLEEEILLAVGRLHGPRAAEALARLLDDPRNPHRAAVAIALGMTGQASAAEPLVRLLLDEEPFVRLCSSESLRHLTREEHFADWVAGTSADRAAAAEEYFRWVAEQR